MPHFFINSKDVNNNFIQISDGENFNHIAKSLRIESGEAILLIDENRLQYEGVVNQVTKKTVDVDILKVYPSKRFLTFELFLAQSPLRSDAQNLIIEKATELGVEGVYPILTDNCVLKKSVIEQKIPKWQKIMYESSKQCERAYVPRCFDLTNIKDLLEKVCFDRIIAFTEREAQMPLKQYLLDYPINNGEKVLIIIGPEGGFSQKEFEFFKQKEKIVTLSLGDLILRAETAVITAIGAIVL